ncbi:5384_t:CDS:2, partial [Scutellospora calospora]
SVVIPILMSILIGLTFMIFPPLFLYATESFNSVTITFLILYGGLAINVYGLIIVIKFVDNSIVIIVNLVVGCCISSLKGTKIEFMIANILWGFDYYIIFYNLQDKVNPISLLLFWVDLWTISVSIYIAFEKLLNGEKIEEQGMPEFDIENYRRV